MSENGTLQKLARRVAEIAGDDANEKRRERWRRHNEFEDRGIPIYIRAVADREIIVPQLESTDPFLRNCELFLRRMILQSELNDDYVIEPWITVAAAKSLPDAGAWGVPTGRAAEDLDSGAFTIAPPLKEEIDIGRLIPPRHRIDEEATGRLVSRLHDTIGDELPIVVSRAPYWSSWHADLSTDLGYLRGIEQMLWDMMDRPKWIARLLEFMRDGVLKAQSEAEEAGDWRFADHENQSMPYAASLDDPRVDSRPAKRSELWGFFASQETGAVSPGMFDEFMVEYQRPIAEEYAMISYGCCEDLSRKIDVLRSIKNLRRIAVSPFADVARSAEAIGSDYICSWRPSPADMVAYGFDEERVRRIVRNAREIFEANGSRYDVCLKDVETVQHDVKRIHKFVELVREETETESFAITA